MLKIKLRPLHAPHPRPAPRLFAPALPASGASGCLLAALTVFVMADADAAYPTKPIRLIVPYAPGGGNDTMARAIGAKLSAAWNQQVIIDNRPGANGLVAGELAATAAPDS